MSRDEQARELARQWRAQVYYALKPLGDAAIRALQSSVEDKILEALRGASGGGIAPSPVTDKTALSEEAS